MDRTRLGALVWASILQYFVMLLVVRSAWTLPFDPLVNAISDLGAAECGEFNSRQVCSPWHDWANISWVLTGAALAGGALLLRPAFGRTRTATVGTILLVASGIGEIGVGLHPEDVSAWHLPSALVAIGCGLPGILLLGWSLRRTPGRRAIGWTGVGLGTVGLVAAVLIAVPAAPFGLVERLAAYPILLWALCCGVVMLRRPARQPDTPQDTPYG